MYPANTEVIKEPRGFIKFLEIIIAICAFATTTSHHSASYLDVICPNNNGSHQIELQFGYTYKLEDTIIHTPVCPYTGLIRNETIPKGTIRLYGNFSSSAEFYVFVGVMAFLYSLAALALYIFGDEQYQQNDSVPIIDFIITLVFAAFWLIASSVWADDVSKIKHYTDPNDIINDRYLDFQECHEYSYANVTCKSAGQGNFASLNVSIIFGFLNLVLWAGNLWFLYKETKWFKPPKGLSPDHTSPDDPQRM